MSRLVRNTLINVSAFSVNAVVGFLLVPVLVGAYGVEQYGLIILARNLLPAGLLVLLDFGLSEAATRHIASSRAAGDGERVRNIIFGTLAIVVVVGGACAATMFFAADVTVSLLGVPPELRADFMIIVGWSAACLMVWYPGMVAKGVLEGFERFDIVRLGEVMGTIVFAIGVVLLAMNGHGYEQVAVLFAIIGAARSVFLLAQVVLEMRRWPSHGSQWRGAQLRPVLRHALSFFQGKLLSSVFNNLPVILISQIAGPAATGIYDVIMRIPRLVKVVSGVFASALLPFSARFEVHPDREGTHRAIRVGTRLSLATIVPVASSIIAFSGAVLSAWVSPDFGSYAPWLALAMAWPMLFSWAGIGAGMIIARPSGIVMMNRVSLLQIVVFFAVSTLLASAMGPFAFVLGTVIAACVAAPLQVRLVCAEYGLSAREHLRLLTKSLVPVIAAIMILMLDVGQTERLAIMLAELALWSAVWWAWFYVFAISDAERAVVRTAADMIMRTWARH